MGASDAVYRYVNPMMQVLRPIPPIAYIPLSILWFGLGNPPAVFLIAIGAFFPVLMNTIAGVRHVDGIYIRAARNLGASGATMFLRIAAGPLFAFLADRLDNRRRVVIALAWGSLIAVCLYTVSAGFWQIFLVTLLLMSLWPSITRSLNCVMAC